MMSVLILLSNSFYVVTAQLRLWICNHHRRNITLRAFLFYSIIILFRMRARFAGDNAAHFHWIECGAWDDGEKGISKTHPIVYFLARSVKA